MRAEVLFLLAALVAQHNGVSIPAVYWTAFGVWAVAHLMVIAYKAAASQLERKQQ